MTVKKLDSGYRIIKILKLLCEKPVCLDEICMALEHDGLGINKETVSRYFATLREFGCVIQKRGGKFILRHSPSFFDTSEDELKILAMLKDIAADTFSDEENSTLEGVYKKLFALLNSNDAAKFDKISKAACKIKNSSLKAKINELTSLIKRKDAMIEITYNGKKIEIKPKCIKYYKQNVYLYAHDASQSLNRLFLLEKIENICLLSYLGARYEFNSTTTFKITGRLEKTYALQNGETVIKDNGFSFVTNKNEDKELLFKRLIRYGPLCEVVYTAQDRKDFKDMVEKLIVHHGG